LRDLFDMAAKAAGDRICLAIASVIQTDGKLLMPG